MANALAALAAVTFVSSCAFDLQSVPRPQTDAPISDANPPDGPPASDGSSDAAVCPAMTVTASPEADTDLASASPTLNFGNSSIANVGTGVGSVGLFRFNVAALPATARIQSARVDFTYAATSSHCAAACGSCASIEHAGTLSLFAMRSDWVELEATWSNAATGRLWASPGASQAGVDRSMAPIAAVSHAAAASERFSVDAAALMDLNGMWRQNDRLSFELVPSAAAVMILATRESAIEACVAGGYAPAKLTITYCP